MQDPVRLVLPFKDQASADIVRAQLSDLSQNKKYKPDNACILLRELMDTRKAGDSFNKSRGFLKHFVIKTIGMRKRRFDRSTVIIKQSEDKNFHKY